MTGTPDEPCRRAAACKACYIWLDVQRSQEPGGCAAVEWAPESAAQYDVSSLERPPQAESARAAQQREEERRQSSFSLQQCLEVRCRGAPARLLLAMPPACTPAALGNP